MQPSIRRYDLDWLRIIAFGFLIFYHTGMLYVADWGFHYKSQYESELLQYLMLMVNPWRMPLLFFISGIAIRYVLNSRSLLNTLLSRTWRLLLPLSFGIVAIVPIQLFIEMKNAGAIDFGLGQFYSVFFDLHHPAFSDFQSGIFPHIDVNHLWYLRELWQFSLLLIVCHPILNHSLVKRFVTKLVVSRHIILIICVVPFMLSVVELIFFPDSEEGRRIARGFCFFLLGYVIFENTIWWQTIITSRRLLLGTAILCSTVFLCYYGLIWLNRNEPLIVVYQFIERLFVFMNRWLSLLVICAYASTYLNKPHPQLHFWSAFVYPSYLVHQSILIAACFYLTPYAMGEVLEPLFVLLITFAGCVLVYLVGRNTGLIAELVGIFVKRKSPDLPIWTFLRIVLWAVVLFVGFSILV